MSAKQKQRTTLGVFDDTKERFEEIKPYETISTDEFVNHLLDRWEGRR